MLQFKVAYFMIVEAGLYKDFGNTLGDHKYCINGVHSLLLCWFFGKDCITHENLHASDGNVDSDLLGPWPLPSITTRGYHLYKKWKQFLPVHS